MPTDFIAAAIQMTATFDKRDNLDRAEKLTAEAARAGATLIVLPELFSAYGPLSEIARYAEPIPGPTADLAAGWAAAHGVYLCAGSIAETDGCSPRCWNTSLLFDPQGRLLAKYQKMHLFDVAVSEELASRESQFMQPGETLAVTRTPLGRLGQAICYDLRFPELFRRLTDRGAEILLFPSAFTATTGRDHWEPLVRARAIESQAYFIAADLTGDHGARMRSHGHSCIIDPWGRAAAMAAGDGDEVVSAEIRLDSVREARQRVPSLLNRRIF